jgi:hypothetical protein
MTDYIDKSSRRTFMLRKQSSSFGLYKNEENDSWGTDLTSRIQTPFLVQRSEFAGFLLVLERDLRWLESTGAIGFKIPLWNKVMALAEYDPEEDDIGDVPPLVCINDKLTEVHCQYLGFISFPSILAVNKVQIVN